MHFDGTDGMIEHEGPAEAADQLDALVSHVQRAVDRHEVTFLATDVDRDGGKIILTAGPPPPRATTSTTCCWPSARSWTPTAPLPLRIGVNRGSVFVGEVGPPYRRTFTVMGDTVNLAARLMAKAEPGEILTTPEVIARAQAGFATDRARTVLREGEVQTGPRPEVGAMPAEAGGAATEDLPFVGEDREVAELESCVGRAEEGNGALIEIVGEPGSGSRGYSDSSGSSPARGPADGRCERYYSSTPYHVVRELLRGSSSSRPREPGRPPSVPGLADGTGPGAVCPGTADRRRRSDLRCPKPRRRPSWTRSSARPAWPTPSGLLANLLPDSGLLTVEDAHFMDESSADLFGPWPPRWAPPRG